MRFVPDPGAPGAAEVDEEQVLKAESTFFLGQNRECGLDGQGPGGAARCSADAMKGESESNA